MAEQTYSTKNKKPESIWSSLKKESLSEALKRAFIGGLITFNLFQASSYFISKTSESARIHQQYLRIPTVQRKVSLREAREEIYSSICELNSSSGGFLSGRYSPSDVPASEKYINRSIEILDRIPGSRLEEVTTPLVEAKEFLGSAGAGRIESAQGVLKTAEGILEEEYKLTKRDAPREPLQGKLVGPYILTTMGAMLMTLFSGIYTLGHLPRLVSPLTERKSRE